VPKINVQLKETQLDKDKLAVAIVEQKRLI